MSNPIAFSFYFFPLFKSIKKWSICGVCYYLVHIFYGFNFLKPQPTSAISWSQIFSSEEQQNLSHQTRLKLFINSLVHLQPYYFVLNLLRSNQGHGLCLAAVFFSQTESSMIVDKVKKFILFFVQ